MKTHFLNPIFMKTRHRLRKMWAPLSGCLLMTGSLIGLSACDMVNEDFGPCAPVYNIHTTVNFVYDYNMSYSDLFIDHVGSVYLYIFDEDGVFLHRETRFRSDMGKVIDFSMPFDTTLLKPGTRYQMVAVAQGNRSGYAASLSTPGFQVVNDMIEGHSRIEDYLLRLDRKHPDGTSGAGEFEYKDIYGNTQTMIDTIWSTKPDEVQIVDIPALAYKPDVVKQDDVYKEVTIPMMRITNSIKVNLVSSYFDEDTNTDDYSMIIYFPYGNGTIDFTGNVLPFEELRYRTLRKNLISYIPGKDRNGSIPDPVSSPGSRAEAHQYAVQGEFGVSRMMLDDDSSLIISDANTGNQLAEIPEFSKFLATAFDYYGDQAQEFLDREYDFEVSIGVNDTRIVWIDVYIEVLDWYVRFNNPAF